MTDERRRKPDTVFRRDHYRCKLCGASADTAAYFVSPKYVPTDELSNLMAVCYTCRPGVRKQALQAS
jgi:5-methylcytosine-specific restriction endonuclease McrA